MSHPLLVMEIDVGDAFPPACTRTRRTRTLGQKYRDHKRKT